LLKRGLRQNSRDAGTIVLRTPTFAEPFGMNTTRPSGIKVAPLKLAPHRAALEYVKVTGSTIPILVVELFGTHTILPDGRSAPPRNETVPMFVIFDMPVVRGLVTTDGL
jgi:hypothetical protein